MQEPQPKDIAKRFAAPGRVNLIGEHTDYSGGLVMPVAIDLRTVATICPRGDSKILISSQNLAETVPYSAESFPATGYGHWSDYPMGVAWSLAQQGIRAGGFELALAGDIPLGAGLSSSASIEVATAFALLALASARMPLPQIALACQRAENDFVGTHCGIMDQFIACAGREDHALLLDCRSLEYSFVPIPSDARIVICNSMVKHRHVSGEYNRRRSEVDEGTRILHRLRPSIETLRDATEADLMSSRDEMPENVFRRCRHIVTENQRVRLAAETLRRGDVAAFGAVMVEGHRSMRDDFQASCRELDVLVDLARRLPGCYGARMTGGGFGGCTVNLVDQAHAKAFCDALWKEYRAATAIDAEVYLCRVAAGASALESPREDSEAKAAGSGLHF